jgi:hypothetical protein
LDLVASANDNDGWEIGSSTRQMTKTPKCRELPRISLGAVENRVCREFRASLRGLGRSRC